MTEGISLFFIGLGILFFESATRIRGSGSSWLSILSGLCLGAAILHRQIWVMTLGGIAFVWISSFYRGGFKHLRGPTLSVLCSSTLAIILFTLWTGGVFIGGVGQNLQVPHLSTGNWLLSFLAFLPLYGLGMMNRACSEKEPLPKPPRRNLFIIFSMGIVAFLIWRVVHLDSANNWLGHGPVKSLLQLTGSPTTESLFLFLSATLGLFLLMIELSRLKHAKEWPSIFTTGTLLALAIMTLASAFPTTFYERYMISPMYCILLATKFPINPTWLFTSQVGILLLFQAGVSYSNGLFSF